MQDFATVLVTARTALSGKALASCSRAERAPLSLRGAEEACRSAYTNFQEPLVVAVSCNSPSMSAQNFAEFAHTKKHSLKA